MFTYSQLLSKTNPDVIHRSLNLDDTQKNDCRGTVRICDADVTFMQLQNFRPYQEDAFAIAKVKGFDALRFEAQELALKETFRKLDAKYGQVSKVGTTACVVITSQDHTVIANIGDSAAFYVGLNRDEKLLLSTRLNSLHSPTEKNEKERIEKGGGQVFRGRVGNLSVSRALGDQSQKSYGVISTPDVTHFPHLPGVNGCIAAATDGVTLDEKELGDIVQKTNTSEIDYQLITKTREKEASKEDSKSRPIIDNMTALVSPLFPAPPAGFSRSMIVCDGHGGDQVAKAICENFYATLEIEIERVSTPEKFAETKAQAERELAAEAAEKIRQQRNRDTINAQFQAYARKMETPDLKIFTEATRRYHHVSYEMFFAAKDGSANGMNDQLEELAKENKLPMYSYGCASASGEDTNCFRIWCEQDVDTLPANFVTFFKEAEKIINPRSDAVLLSTFGLLGASEGKKAESATPTSALKLTG